MDAKLVQARGGLRHVGVGGDAQDVLRAQFRADVDHLLVEPHVAAGLDPDHLDIEQRQAGIRQRGARLAGPGVGPRLGIDPQADLVETASQRGADGFDGAELRDHARGEADRVHIELPPSMRNSAPVVKPDSSEAR